MKNLYILSLLAFLPACVSGVILDDTPSATPVEKAVVEQKKEPKPEPVAETTKASAETVVEVKKQRLDYVPYSPSSREGTSSRQIYTVLASRTTNKMLKSTPHIYSNGKYPSLFIKNPVTKGDFSVPETSEYAATVTKDIITGSHSYLVTEYAKKADYILEIFVSGHPVAERGSAVIVYKTVLKDRQNKEIGTWTEILTPIMNDDKSWW